MVSEVQIYTDGACEGNPGPGGWAAVVKSGKQVRELKGKVEQTTNNRMEVLAAIKGLEATPEGSDVTVFSDSQYLVNTMTRGWHRRANLDLWTRLDYLTVRRKVDWQWIRGHAGHPENEQADRLANEMAGIEGERVPASLTHLDSSGRVQMVDVGGKAETEREAVAKGSVAMKPETLRLIVERALEKGDVLAVARVAGIMAAKQAHSLIPLCHPIPLSHVSVEVEPNEGSNTVDITATVKATAKTGAEMEALTAVAVAALTVYDMAKAVDREMCIEGMRLVRKRGGKSGDMVLEQS